VTRDQQDGWTSAELQTGSDNTS